MSLVNTTDLDFAQAAGLIESIRRHVGVIWESVERAYLGRAWIALGYSSWDDMCDAEFDGARIPLPREQRQEVVGSLRDAGMSTRAIAAALGVSKNTVTSDLSQTGTPAGPIVGADGKAYPAHITTRTTETTTVVQNVDLETGEILDPAPVHGIERPVVPLDFDRPAEQQWEESHSIAPEPEWDDESEIDVLADLSDEAFEEALDACRLDGDMSRGNVVHHAQAIDQRAVDLAERDARHARNLGRLISLWPWIRDFRDDPRRTFVLAHMTSDDKARLADIEGMLR